MGARGAWRKPRRSGTEPAANGHSVIVPLPMNMSSRRPAVRLSTALISAAFACVAGAQQVAAPGDMRLPDLGSSANTVLTPTEARQYGAQGIAAIRSPQRRKAGATCG